MRQNSCISPDASRNVKNDTAKAEYDAWMARLRAQAFVKKYPMPDEVK